MMQPSHPNDIVRENIVQLLGDIAKPIEDEKGIIAWLKRNFPIGRPSSTCEWTAVPNAKIIAVNYTDKPKIRRAFKNLLQHVQAHDEDQVYVFWHSTLVRGLTMPLWACRKVFELLIDIDGQEMHIVSPDVGWYIEFDPFFNEFSGARVPRTQD